MRMILRACVILQFLTAAVGAIAATDPSPVAAPVPPVVSPEPAAPPPGPVVLDGKTLFVVKGRILSFSAAERGRAITERLERLATVQGAAAGIRAVDGEAATDIVAADLVLMSVTDGDAAAAGKPRLQLAQEHAEVLRAALSDYEEQRGVRSLLTAALYAALATVVLFLLIWVVRRATRWLQQRIDTERGRLIRTLRFQSIEILTEARIVTLLHNATNVGKIVLFLLILDLYLTTVLRLFPWTRGFAERLSGYVLQPLQLAGRAFIDFLPNIFFIGVIIAVTYVVTRATRLVFNEIGRGTITLPGFYADWAAPTFNILRFLIIAFAAVVIFPYLPGADSPAFKGISVFLGVLFSLGSSSAIANVVSGVILTYTRAFNLGDRVQIGETIGDVVEKTLLVTRVRTIKNVDITIPNALVLGSHVINYSTSAGSHGLILHTGVTIGYDVPWRQVNALLQDAALRTTHILREPAPFVLQTSLDDFYVAYQINAYTVHPQNMAGIYSELHQHIQDCFNEAGVEIMSPHYATLRDGNPTTIPSTYLPGDYRPPAFGVRIDRGKV